MRRRISGKIVEKCASTRSRPARSLSTTMNTVCFKGLVALPDISSIGNERSFKARRSTVRTRVDAKSVSSFFLFSLLSFSFFLFSFSSFSSFSSLFSLLHFLFFFCFAFPFLLRLRDGVYCTVQCYGYVTVECGGKKCASGFPGQA